MTSLGEQLLELQDQDLEIDRLRHRRDTLPARAELAEGRRLAGRLDTDLEEARARLAEVAGRQSRVERELEATEARLADVEKRLYSGSVTASRELVSMSGESDQLKERRSHLEDELLELMEAREPHDAEVSGLDQRRADLLSEMERLEDAAVAEEAVIDRGLADMEASRATLAAAFPDAALLDSYDRLRRHLGGVGAARLVGSMCSGCHLVLAAQEVDRMRRLPPDELLSCEQCGRILVR